MENEHKYTNDLINESSPYLLQHAHNPVQWRAWNDETLALAQKEDKPILISIGYSACHWCHVMEHESFENEEVAEIMNANFICIKVDREERPDVDQVYMSAVQMITGSGGWPLNCFALPDGRPFHGGTYFRKGQWVQLLKAISKEFTENRDKLEKFADRLTQGIVQGNIVPKAGLPITTYKPTLTSTVEKWKEGIDNKWGGPDREPKFPLPNNYQFLMQYAFQTEDPPLISHVELTLDKMAKGGIYDQIGGGFARYSTDKYWKVPHFEKMLYDNAQLLSLYADGYLAYGKERYKEVLDQTVDFIALELTDKSGAFYSALDADSEGEEGKYYVWSKEELKELFGEDYSILEDLFILDRFGMWEGHFVLMANKTNAEVMKAHHLTEDQFKSKKSMIVDRMQKMRSRRVKPGLDDKTLTSWNALTVSGLLDVYRATNNQKAFDLALANLDFILDQQLQKNGSLWHSYKNKTSSIQGFIEDYAFVIQACIDMYECTADNEYLIHAGNLMEYCRNNFFDKDQHMFRFNERSDKQLIVNSIEYQDNVIPSSNSVMARNLQSLFVMTGNTIYRDMAESMLAPIVPMVARYGSSFSNWAQLMMHKDYQHYEVVIVGKEAETAVEAFNKEYLPNAIVIASKKGSDDVLFESRYQKGKTLIYLCKGNVCEAPVELDKLGEIIAKIKLIDAQ